MAANPNLIIRIAASVADLQKNISEGKVQIEALGDAVKRLGKSFDGSKLIQDANNVVAAVDKIGGASKLTAAEQARVNKTVEEAIQKYAALGKVAPQAMVDLAAATKQIKIPDPPSPAGFSAIGVALGTIAGNLVTKGLSLVGAELGNIWAQSQKLNAVAPAYGRLTASIQQDSGAMLDAMRDGTHGLVANVDMMQAANKAILLGLPVTTESMGKLAGAATSLGRAMGQDATKSLDDLITALGRSSPMILDNLGLSVKVGEANEAYARALGKSADALTDAEKKMAFYTAAMEAADRKTKALGEQTLTLTETLSAGWTTVSDVAVSALSRMNKALGERFTTDLNDPSTPFGAMRAYLALFREVKGGGDLGTMKAPGSPLSKGGTSGALPVPDIDEDAQRAQKAAINRAVADMEAYAKRVSDLGKQLNGSALAAQVKLLADGVTAAGGAAKLSAYEHERLGKQLEGLRAQGAQLTPELRDIWVQHIELKGVTTDLSATIKAMSIPAIKELTKATEQWSAASLQAKWANTNLLNSKVSSPSAGLAGLSTLGGNSITSLGKAPGKNVAESLFGMSSTDLGKQFGSTIVQAFTNGGNPLQAAGSLAGNKIGESLVTKFGAKVTGMLGKTLGGVFSSLIPGVGALLGPLVGKLGGWLNDHLFGGKGAKANDLRDSIKEKFGDAAGHGLEAFIDKFNGDKSVMDAYNRFMKAGTEEAVKAAYADLQKATGAAQDAIDKTAAEAQAAADKTRAAIERWGLSLDDLKSPAERASKAMGDLVDDYGELKRSGFGDEQIAKGMASGLNAAILAAIETGTKIPAALEPVMQQLIRGGGLSEDLAMKMLGITAPEVTPWKEMQAAAEEFGVNLDELGEKFDQSKLSEEAQNIADKWHLLVDNGASVGGVMAGMKDEISGIVDKALKLGLELPANLQPIVEKMSEAGLLTDDTGKKLEGLDKLQFTHIKTVGEEIAESLEPLLARLDTLIERLTGPDGLAAALDGLPSPTVTVGVEYDYGAGPQGQPATDQPDWGGAQAAGGDYFVKKPTMFLAGEAGPEQVSFSGANRSFSGGLQIELVSKLNAREVSRELIQINAEELKRLAMA